MKPTNPTPAKLVTDPVCGMSIDPAAAAANTTIDGSTYYFCASSCKEEFDAGHGPLAEAAPDAGDRRNEGSCCGR
jgi:Cu+-exporting ATPase